MNNKGSIGWIIALKNRWKLLLLSFLIPAILAFIISIFLPKKYESTAEILSPEISSGRSIIQTPLGAIAKGGTGSAISTQAIITILSSNYANDRINRKFKIQKIFNLKNKILTRDYIKNNMINVVNDEKNGIIKIKVKSRYNQLNSKIANYYITVLDSANEYLKLTTNRNFIKVLSYAEPAIIPFSPRKKLNALLAGLLGVIFAVIYIYFKDNLTLSDEL